MEFYYTVGAKTVGPLTSFNETLSKFLTEATALQSSGAKSVFILESASWIKLVKEGDKDKFLHFHDANDFAVRIGLCPTESMVFDETKEELPMVVINLLFKAADEKNINYFMNHILGSLINIPLKPKTQTAVK